MAPEPTRNVADVPAETVCVAASEALRTSVRELSGNVAGAVLRALGTTLPSSAEEFARLERQLSAIAVNMIVGPVLAAVLHELHASQAFVAASVTNARKTRPLQVHRAADVSLTLAHGAIVSAVTPYATPPRPSRKKRRVGRPRAQGRRGLGGSGCYPVLAKLGFLGCRSPAYWSAVARAAAEVGSYAEARASLASRGLEIDYKTLRCVTHQVADAGLEARRCLENAAETRELEGKRVVVAFDGGRVRTRVQDKRGRPRKETGRVGFDAPWREPALVAVYVVGDDGKKLPGTRPWYEATLGGWDAQFGLAVDLLRRLGARHAREVVIAGDGAASIWDRVDDLVGATGIPPARVRKFADFWHAVEHLHAVAELLPASWSDEQRATWVRYRRRALFEGKVDDVIAAIREHVLGRNAKLIEGEAEYFEKRTHLMRYDKLRAANLPIGTGAVESAIRRVVNLRMKGPGIFWDEANAERMLLLRCRLKSGRWDDLEREVYAQTAALHGRALENSRE